MHGGSAHGRKGGWPGLPARGLAETARRGCGTAVRGLVQNWCVGARKAGKCAWEGRACGLVRAGGKAAGCAVLGIVP